MSHRRSLAAEYAGHGPDVCLTCRRLEEHYGRDLRTITAEERARFLAADAAVGYAVHDELGRYPDRAGWGL